MKVAAAQYPLMIQSSFDAWKKYMERWVREAVKSSVDIVLFSEYGSLDLVSLFPLNIKSNFSLQVFELQHFYTEINSFFTKLAQDYRVILISPSFPTPYLNKIINRVKVYSPSGFVGNQDKIFITKPEKDNWNIQSGDPILNIFETIHGNFGIQICYDIEFPLGAKLLAESGADVIFVPSCTKTIQGAYRVHLGARARAMECQIYTVVAQTIDRCDWLPTLQENYGFSAAYSTPDAGFSDDGIITQGTPQTKSWVFVDLDLEKLKIVRKHGKTSGFQDSKLIHMNLTNHPLTVRRIRVS